MKMRLYNKVVLSWAIALFFALFAFASSASATTTTTTTTTDPVCTTGDCVVKLAVVTTTPGPTTTTTTTTKSSWTKNIETYERKTGRTVVIWYSSVPMKRVGVCYEVGRGTKYAWFWNSFKRASDGKQVWFKDRRRSTLCGPDAKHLRRTACTNPSRLPSNPPPAKAKRVKHIREFRTIREVRKVFKEKGSSSSTTTTVTTTTVSDYVCEPGWTKFVGNDSKVYCKQCPPPVCKCPLGSTTGSDGKCHKDGTTTPPPPIEAPGTNPPPSSDDPTQTPENPTGSWACYSETTGLPVQPVNGLCPPGSYGMSV